MKSHVMNVLTLFAREKLDPSRYGKTLDLGKKIRFSVTVQCGRSIGLKSTV